MTYPPLNHVLYSVTGIGQDSHAFSRDVNKPLVLAGITITDHIGLQGNSDADVVLHALCNALSSISGTTILGAITDTMCKQGITDSKLYLEKAIQTMQNHALVHIAISIECKTPKLSPWIATMRSSLAGLTKLKTDQIGITATSGEGLTAFGKGEGIQAFVIATAVKLPPK